MRKIRYDTPTLMWKVTKHIFITSMLSLILCGSSHATVIQILHTNDLHAALETFGAPDVNEDEYGGWAQLKAKMDELTASATAQGIETVKLDAGDFTEGTSFYFADKGARIMRAFQHLGYDATAMGNHDWLMGAQDMDDLYGANPFPFPVLSANVKIHRSLRNLRKQIVPSTQILRGGLKIGVFGLSTDEALYSWITSVNSRKKDMKIEDYRDSVLDDDGEAGSRRGNGIANDMIADLRRDNDVVIGLTHIGYEEDKILAQDSRGLDLIVGGHSHTFLQTATMVPNRDGQNVPVVQTGFNAKYVGKILLDVERGRPAKLISYELIPVMNSDAKDPVIEADVHAAETARHDLFGNRMNEIIGLSEDRLVSGDAGPTSFSTFVVDSMKAITGADLAVDVGAFHGNTPQAAGPVSRLNLMEMYPRKFEQEQNEGLYVYEVTMPGILLRLGLQYAAKFGTYVATSGVTYDLEKMSDAEFAQEKRKYAGTVNANIMTPYYPSRIQVNGYPLHDFVWYNVAAPESLVRGAFGITNLAKIAIHRAHPTPHTIWDAMNLHLLRIGTIPKIPPNRGPNPWSPEIRSPRMLIARLMTEVVGGMNLVSGREEVMESPETESSLSLPLNLSHP